MRAEPIAETEWRAAVAPFRDLSYRQCESYARRAAATTRSKVEFVRIVEDKTTRGVVAVRVNALGQLPFGIAYAHHGPLTAGVDGSCKPETFLACVRALKHYYVHSRGLSLRVVPPYRASEHEALLRSGFRDLGFQLSSEKPRHTQIFDTMGDPARALAHLGQQWRRNLRKAQKAKIEIEEDRSEEMFAKAGKLLIQLEATKGFDAPQDVNFFRDVDRSAGGYERYRLFVAKSCGKVIAVHLASYVGDTSVFLLGAGDEEARQTNASYLLHWRAVEETARLGLRWYDLGGVDRVANPSGYQFKNGMRGIEIAELGAYDCAPDPIRGASLTQLTRLGRSARGLMSRWWTTG